MSDTEMTPMEAWSIVAPILSAHSVHYKGTPLNAIDEAYIIVFEALKRMEKEQEHEYRESKSDI